jgi:hypothetical protein
MNLCQWEIVGSKKLAVGRRKKMKNTGGDFKVIYFKERAE